ncbi:DUF4087 domain-containing protein [Buttiauxella ferragutiae]
MLIVICIPSIALAKETRCGWLDNATPSNLWLIDKDTDWNI